jgi:hypothetical protein
MYRTGSARAYCLGIVVFGGGYLLFSRVLSTDAAGNPVAFTNRALDTPALNLRSAPADGAKILAGERRNEGIATPVVCYLNVYN